MLLLLLLDYYFIDKDLIYLLTDEKYCIIVRLLKLLIILYDKDLIY